MSRARPSIVDFVTDPALLGLSISPAQRTLLMSAYGVKLSSSEEREIFRLCTNREKYLTGHVFGELTVMAGARSGKDSRIAAPIVCYEAAFGGHDKKLARGERGMIALVAQDARAARIAFDYIKAYFEGSPVLAKLVAEPRATEIALTNGITVAVFPSTLRSLRGYSIPCAVMDELAFFRLEGSADSDAEIQTSIRRGGGSFGGTKLIKISTPYMRSGVLFDDFTRSFGQDDPDLLVWRAPSRLMNPDTITEKFLDTQQRLDPARFAREYLADFIDTESFLSGAWIDAAISRDRHELAPQSGIKYVAAIDPHGGGQNAFTLSIVHAEGRGPACRIVQDVMRAWNKPRDAQVDLTGVVETISATLRSYGITRVISDRYAKAWVRDTFRRFGITVVEATTRRSGESTVMDTSTAYLETEPLFAQGRIEILDNPTMIRELRNLERRPGQGGRDRVDHPSRANDDHAAALAFASATCAEQNSHSGGFTLVASVGRNWITGEVYEGRVWESRNGEGATTEIPRVIEPPRRSIAPHERQFIHPHERDFDSGPGRWWR